MRVTQNICHLLHSRSMGSRVSFQDFTDQKFSRNIKEGNLLKTIFNGHKISLIHIQGHLALTEDNQKSLQLWDLKTGKCRWTFTLEKNMSWDGELKITDSHVVFSGFLSIYTRSLFIPVIRVIDLETGVETVSITAPQMRSDKTCAVGAKIFAVLRGGKIREWDMSGKVIQTIDSKDLNSLFARFLASENFLVHTSNHTVVIHNLQKKNQMEITLDCDEATFIAASHIRGYDLICVFSSCSSNMSDSCIIDLFSGKITYQYRPIEAFLHLREPGTIRDIILDKKEAYLAYTGGILIAADLAENTRTQLGQHKNLICHLAKEGNLLISESTDFTNPSDIKYWDTRSKTLLKEMELPNLIAMVFSSGKVLAVTKHSFIQLDYTVSHKGEQFTENSALTIETKSEECCIL
jgi:WD40 repeat protein